MNGRPAPSWPCPCCGRVTLSEGPGDYDWCVVCGWEDDGGQLRYPMRADGANGISLVEAQQRFARRGGRTRRMHGRADPERFPLDDGFRPFDPERDWQHPHLESDRQPVNPAALYYWRPTYWNGDQHRLAAEPRPRTTTDAFLDHLRTVPDLAEVIAASEQQWGEASAFDVCDRAHAVVVEAYRGGDVERAERVLTALAPGAEGGGPLDGGNAVVIGFLEDLDPLLEAAGDLVDRWPEPLLDEVRERQRHPVEAEASLAARHDAWCDLLAHAPDRPLHEVVDHLRALQGIGDTRSADPRTLLGVETTARFLVDPRWLYRHPLDSVRLAWRFRAVRSPMRTIAALRRPRFAG